MDDSTPDHAEGFAEAEEGFFPEPCPVCSRVNFRWADDYCEHFWATVYDGEMIDGPFSSEFEELWSRLHHAYQATDDVRAERLIEMLHAKELSAVAEAMVNEEKLWWLDQVRFKNVIEPEASLASGSGWNLYQLQDGWFVETMRELRIAVEIARKTVS